MENRVDRILVQVVVTAYNEAGQPLAEQVAQPICLFRAATPDVWAHIDQLIAKQNTAQ